MVIEKTLSCIHCGAAYIVYPPDDFHLYASVTEEGVASPAKMTYKCQNCGKENTIYWGNLKLK